MELCSVVQKLLAVKVDAHLKKSARSSNFANLYLNTRHISINIRAKAALHCSRAIVYQNIIGKVLRLRSLLRFSQNVPFWQKIPCRATVIAHSFRHEYRYKRTRLTIYNRNLVPQRITVIGDL